MSLLLLSCEFKTGSIEILSELQVEDLIKSFNYEDTYDETKKGVFLSEMKIIGNSEAEMMFVLLADDGKRDTFDVDNLLKGKTDVDYGVIVYANSEEDAENLLYSEILKGSLENIRHEAKGDENEFINASIAMKMNPIEYFFSEKSLILSPVDGDWVKVPDEIRRVIQKELQN
jgi:hypothetical protein